MNNSNNNWMYASRSGGVTVLDGIRFNNNGIEFFYRGAPTAGAITSALIVFGVASQVVIRFKESQYVKIFINGVLVANESQVGNNLSGNTFLDGFVGNRGGSANPVVRKQPQQRPYQCRFTATRFSRDTEYFVPVNIKRNVADRIDHTLGCRITNTQVRYR